MIEIKNITKSYSSNGKIINALNNISMNIGEGEFLVVKGASGSGKTTLLLTLGGMLKPSKGNYFFEDKDIYLLNGKARNQFRATKIGFVFQMFHLLPYLTVLENVIIPSFGKLKERAENILNELGLKDRKDHIPFALSAGEKQRAAVARALINNPKVILADEPTGNLDPQNAKEVMNSFLKFKNSGGTVVVVTHGSEADKYADRIIILKDGKLVKYNDN